MISPLTQSSGLTYFRVCKSYYIFRGQTQDSPPGVRGTATIWLGANIYDLAFLSESPSVFVTREERGEVERGCL